MERRGRKPAKASEDTTVSRQRSWTLCFGTCTEFCSSSSDFYLFADLKKMLQGKRFSSDDEVITATEAYFEAKDKSFYKKGIETLEKRWNDCIAMEGDYVDE